MTIKAILVDDEPLAHDVVLHHLKQHGDVEVLAQFYHPADALAWLANNSADLLFLDINMPALNGIELLKVLANRPQVVIISAYQEYAVDGFELDVTDYLVKPVSAERLANGLKKVRDRITLSNLTYSDNSNQENTQEIHAGTNEVISNIVLKVDRELRRFELSDITYFEAYGNYVKVWQGNQATLVNSTLKGILEMLPPTQFSKIHKSYIVANDCVVGLDPEHVTLLNEVKLKIGKSYKAEAKRIFA
ncbi:LytTR family DNA-binding domain-containing protein [Psychrosphaera haliotis]|uniref:LytR/AlgR family response regulator transcription factor n=1 Tax=Psychrosphaera haliotis TaxID=555083 RepID=UPI0031DE65E4